MDDVSAAYPVPYKFNRGTISLTARAIIPFSPPPLAMSFIDFLFSLFTFSAGGDGPRQGTGGGHTRPDDPVLD